MIFWRVGLHILVSAIHEPQNAKDDIFLSLLEKNLRIFTYKSDLVLNSYFNGYFLYKTCFSSVLVKKCILKTKKWTNHVLLMKYPSKYKFKTKSY